MYGAADERDLYPVNASAIAWDITRTRRLVPDSIHGDHPTALILEDDDLSESEDEALQDHGIHATVTRAVDSSRQHWRSLSLVDFEANTGYFVFRTSGQKMELQEFRRNSSKANTGVIAVGVLTPEAPENHDIAELWVHRARMGYLIHIPELSLVVVGSMNGNVGLIRLTTMGTSDPVMGFRIEHTLPRLSDIQDPKMSRLRPFHEQAASWWCLHGIAASPIPESRPRSTPSSPNRRFRLLLHYRNHTVLSYELSRNSELEPLIVF